MPRVQRQAARADEEDHGSYKCDAHRCNRCVSDPKIDDTDEWKNNQQRGRPKPGCCAQAGCSASTAAEAKAPILSLYHKDGIVVSENCCKSGCNLKPCHPAGEVSRKPDCTHRFKQIECGGRKSRPESSYTAYICPNPSVRCTNAGYHAP